MTDTPLAAAELHVVVKRRLLGLFVLLLLAFALSLLLRTRAPAPDALPAIVIPLSGSTAVTAAAQGESPAPVLGDQPEPALVAVPAPTRAAAPSRPETSGSAKPVEAIKPAASASTPKPVAEKPKPAQASKPPTAAPAKPAGASRWFVAIGAYKDPMAAKAIANRVQLAGFKASTAAITSSGERLHRVRAGPFGNQADAESARVTLIVEGLTKATVVPEK